MVQSFLRRVADAGLMQPMVEIQANLKSPPVVSPSPTPPPLAVQVLRFRPEEKESAISLKKMRFLYEIETCHNETGNVFHTERSFRELKRLREALLLECRHCPDCHKFVDKLKQSRLPTRRIVVLDPNKYGASRMLELTHFLRDLVLLVTKYAHHCTRDGPDIEKSVGLFLGLNSLSEVNGFANSKNVIQMLPPKTRQDRIDFRAASMPDMCFSSLSAHLSDHSLQHVRVRGYSDVGNVRTRQATLEAFPGTEEQLTAVSDWRCTYHGWPKKHSQSERMNLIHSLVYESDA